MQPTTKKLSREVVTKLHAMSLEVAAAAEFASELLRTAQDRFNHETETFEREGQTITVPRKTLWEEVFYLGHNCQAAELLSKYHQDVFDAYKKQDAIAEDMKKFCILELGCDYTKMRISDYMRLTEEMTNLIIDEREAAKAQA